MKNKVKTTLILVSFIFIFSLSFFSVTFTVGGSNSNFNTIKEAVASARDGDTIFIFPGIYEENLRFQKSLSIVGKERDRVIIKAKTSKSPAILVENSKSVVIESITIETEGIAISFAMSNAVIRNNMIKTSSDGIRGGTLNHSTDVIGNTIIGPLNYEYSSSKGNSNGIVLFGQGKTNINNNQVRGFETGIFITGKRPCYINKNIFSFNNVAMYSGGYTIAEMNENVFSDNFLDGIIIGDKTELTMIKNSFLSNKNWDIRFSGKNCETGVNIDFTGKVYGESNKMDELSRICPEDYDWPESFFID